MYVAESRDSWLLVASFAEPQLLKLSCCCDTHVPASEIELLLQHTQVSQKAGTLPERSIMLQILAVNEVASASEV